MKSSLALLMVPALFLAACASQSPAPTNAKAASLGHELVRGQGARVYSVTGAGQTVLHGLHFPARGRGRGVILCLHGIQTHAAWFGPLARELTPQGWHVLAADRRGSGMNTTTRRGDATGAGELLDDLSAHLRHARTLAAGRPVVLLGTSWGANLAGAHVLFAHEDAAPDADALILLAPATKLLKDYPKWKKLLCIAPTAWLPVRHALPFTDIHYEAGAPQSALSAPPAGDKGVITARLAADRSQGMLVDAPTSRLLWAGNGFANTWTKDNGRLLRMPLFVLLANEDQIMNNAAAAQAAIQRMKSKTKPASLPTGHGGQITHAREIAARMLRWLDHAL